MRTKLLTALVVFAMLITTVAVPMSSLNVSAEDSAETPASYSWNIADLDFSKITSLSSLPANFAEVHQEHEAGSCEAQHGTTFQHLVLENGEIGFSPLQTGKVGGMNYTLDEPIESGKVVISTKYQAYAGAAANNAFNMHIHAVEPPATSYGNGTPGASHLFMISVNAAGKLVLTGKNNTTVTFEDVTISSEETNRQELVIVIDLDTEEVTVETAGKTLETTFEALGHDNDNLKKVYAVGFGFGYARNTGVSNPWNRRGYVSYLKIGDGTVGTPDTDDTTDGADDTTDGADDTTDGADDTTGPDDTTGGTNPNLTYVWNLANLNFKKFSSVSKLPKNLKAQWTHTDCTSHGDAWQHLKIENGELAYSPLKTGEVGAFYYQLDEVQNSGKVVISAKYQAYKGSKFNMYIHAQAPTYSYGQGSTGSRIFMLSVDASGKFKLTGANGAEVIFNDVVLPAKETNRQTVEIVIDFDADTITLETGGKMLETTFAALKLETAAFQQVWGVGFGFGVGGWDRSDGVSPWNTYGYVSNLKIGDGTLGEEDNSDTSDYIMYCGLALVTAVFAISFVAKKKRI